MLNSDESLDLFRPIDLLVRVFLLSRQIFRKTWGTSFWGVCKNRNGTIIILLPNSANGQNFWNFLGITYLMGKIDMATTLTQGFWNVYSEYLPQTWSDHGYPSVGRMVFLDEPFSS